MTRTMKQLSCFLLIATMVFSMLAIPSLAANTCNSISGSGDCGKVTTFTATTNGKWTNGSITLKGTKGTYSSYTWSNEEKTHSIYGYYKVTAKNTKTNKVEFSKKWENSSSIKIKLKRNSTYQITVRSYSGPEILTCRNGDFGKSFAKWDSAPSWSAVTTKHVTYCKNG